MTELLLAPLLSPLVTPGNPWWEVFGRLHPLLLHFPIALIVLGALWAAVLRLLGHRDLTSSTVTFCLWGGLAGASLAAWAGWTLADYQQESGNLVDLHRWFSVSVVVTMVLAAVCDLLRRSERWPWAAGARLIALLVSAVLVSIAGHFGAEMKWGVGWVLAPLETADSTSEHPPDAEAASSTDAVPGATPAVTAEGGDNAAQGQDASEAAPQTGATPIDAVAGEAPKGVTWAQVEPLLEAHCARCHGPDRQKAGLQLVPYTTLFPADEALWVVTPFKPQSSELFRRLSLPMDDVDVMPPDDDGMSPQSQALIKAWIVAGAPGPDGHGPSTPAAPSSGSDDSADSAAKALTPVSPDSGQRANPGDVLPRAMDAAAAGVAINALRGRGIRVRPLHVGSPWLEVSCARVEPMVGDVDLKPLAALAPVVWSIDASRSGLTDAGMTAIASCMQLRSLRLDHTAVGTAGVIQISGLEQLEVLNLFGTPVDDAALATIEGLVALKAVYLGDTAVSASGLEQLRTARETLAVHGNASLPSPEVEDEKKDTEGGGEQDEEDATDKEDKA